MKPPPHSIEIDGFRWFADSPEAIQKLPAILAQQDRRELKRNKYRSIVEIPAPDRAVIKLYEDPRVTQRWRERLTTSHAHKEWNAANKLAGLGISTVRGIAYGEERDGNWIKRSAFLMEALPEVKTLTEVLSDPGLSHSRMCTLISTLAENIHRMHEAGICHRDLHGNNILISNQELHILDLQTIWYLSWFPERAREKNLEQLFYTFEQAGRNGGALRFCQDYLRRNGQGEDPRALFRRLQQWSHRRAQKHFRSQTQRAVTGGSQFQIQQRNPARVFRTGMDVDDIMKNHRSFKGNSPVPVSFRDALVRSWVKIFDHPTRARARSRRAWLGLRALEVRDIPAPKGHAWIEGNPGEPSWILMEYIEEGEPLGKWFRKNSGTMKPEFRHRLSEDLARFVKRIHNREIYHNDYSPKNFLVSMKEDSWQIHIVDPESVQISRGLSERRKIRNLSQLADLGNLSTRTDRLRFLKTYLGDVPREVWEPVARKIWMETRRRISARIARTGQSEPTEP